MKLEGKKILFLGDSITEGGGASDISKRYTNVFAEITGANAVNYGIGGTRIAYQTTPSAEPQFDKNFIDRVDEMDEDADAVVVFGGTNDFGHGDAALGCFDDRTPYTFYGAVHILIEKLLNKYKTTKLMFIIPLQRCENVRTMIKGGKEETAYLKQYVDALREVLEYYSIPALDLYKNSGIQPNVEVMREKYMPDTLHPSDAGHRVIAEKIASFMEVML